MESHGIELRSNGLYVVIIRAFLLTLPGVMSANASSSTSSSLLSSFETSSKATDKIIFTAILSIIPSVMSAETSASTSPFTNGMPLTSSSMSSSSYISLVTPTKSVAKSNSTVSKKVNLHSETVEGKVVICVLLAIAGICMIVLVTIITKAIVSLLSLS